MIETLRTTESPHAKLHSLESHTRITAGFWHSILNTNQEISLLHQYQECERTGRIDNFRRAAGLITPDTPSTRLAPDSDVFKWLEAASYSLARQPSLLLEEKVDQLISLVAAAQSPDGYLNTCFIGDKTKERWQDLVRNHELYCGGHLIQTAIAHHRASGDHRLLDVALRWADHVCDYFGPTAHPGTCGHPEVEMALIELYRQTRNEKYLQQASFFVYQRGQKPPTLNGSPGLQDHLPISQQDTVTGHAVRQLYLMSGLADIYLESGDPIILDNLLKQWQDLSQHKLSITGGLGARLTGESFGLPYELPNRVTYNETCAAIAAFLFYWRMLQVTGQSQYADILEQTLYNGILCGVSLDGQEYFYANPLEHPGDDSSLRSFYGSNRRTNAMWDNVPCCPPNLARILASLESYLYSHTPDTTYLHLYAQSSTTIETPQGPLTLIQETDYPWDGRIEILIQANQPIHHTLALRIPGWSQIPSLFLNDQPLPHPQPGTYHEITKTWQPGDQLTLHLPLSVNKVASHSHLTMNTNTIALMRGPLVYCLEGLDHPDIDIFDLTIPRDSSFTTASQPDLLNGLVTLHTTATLQPPSPNLYFPLPNQDQSIPVPITAIPYYAWANRHPSSMRLWLPLNR